MNVNHAFPSRYLKAVDLGGREITVTIDRVELAGVGRSKEQRAIVYFAGKQKGLILNRVNARRIAEIAGSDETNSWHGVQVRLFVTQVEFSGNLVDAIRIKAPAVANAGAVR